MTSYSLKQFKDRYDLYDRSVVSVTPHGTAQVAIVFDLFHSDDAERSEEGKSYLLTAVFQKSAILVDKGELIHESPRYLGEILDLEDGEGFLRLGIQWTDFQERVSTWTDLRLRDGPKELNEVISED